MDHMPATGEGGFDCYISEGTDEPLYVSTARLEERGREYTATLFSFPKKRELNVVLNFPLYKGVEKVELGVDDDAAVLPPHPLRQGRIAVYGGSIDQGACASRPGMAYTNILSRWMNTEFVNWGFSGSGKAEAEVAKALSEIDDVRLFVINTAAIARAPHICGHICRHFWIFCGGGTHTRRFCSTHCRYSHSIALQNPFR